MYQIIKAGAVLALTETPNYVKTHENGCFVLCREDEAEGIAYNGEVFHLLGTLGMEGLETVTLTETDAGKEIEKIDQAGSITFVTLAEAGSIDAETAGEHAALFEAWVYPKAYKAGQIRRHSGLIYRCILDHTSQVDWTPDTAVSLWVSIADPAEEWPEWSQPVGAHDAYAASDKVSRGGKHWVSDVAGNVWEPGVYGWTEATE